MQIQIKKISGYTLVELLVVIAILVMMLAMAIPSYRVYQQRDEIKNEAESVRSLFWEAQGRSLAPSNRDTDYYKVTNINISPNPAVLNLVERIAGVDASPISKLSFTANTFISDVIATSGTNPPKSLAGQGESWVIFQANPVIYSQQMEICNPTTDCTTYDKMEIIISSRLIVDRYDIVIDKNLNVIGIKKL